jgi:hypothetical protein
VTVKQGFAVFDVLTDSTMTDCATAAAEGAEQRVVADPPNDPGRSSVGVGVVGYSG